MVGKDKVRLTRKFVDGMSEYAAMWPSRVMTVMHPDNKESSGNLDDEVFDCRTLPFEIQCVAFGSDEFFLALEAADIIMFGSDHRLPNFAQWCKDRGKKSVFVSEYSLKTRLQIIRAEIRNPLKRIRKYVWEWRQEKRNRSDVSTADAVQCNGMPTYNDYRLLNPNTLLYLDNRVTADQLADANAIASRSLHLKQGGPIRLAYSGRLSAMKGADDLIEVARHLLDAGQPFSLDIFGDGPLRAAMAARIRKYGLDACVNLRGAVDFNTELMPYMRDKVDLFVCCHRQGDPSCTYIETFSCGVPIVGYDNEALHGLMADRDIGWATPINSPTKLAEEIAILSAAPEQLYSAAQNASEFAAQHHFEIEFRARIDQIKQLVD